MEFWFLLLASICLYFSCVSLLHILSNKKLPPSPPTLPILGNIYWLLKSSKNFADIEPVIHHLRSQYGPIVTLHIGSRPSIFFTTHEAAHRALVKNGTVFAGRPPALETTRVLLSNHCTVSSAPYGPLWRLLRQNLMSVIHISKLKSYSHGRKWAYSLLRDKLLTEAKFGNAIPVLQHVHHAMFGLLSYMCFGVKFDEKTIEDIKTTQQAVLSNFIRFNKLNFFPTLGKIVFRNLWKELLQLRQNRANVLVPIIKARQKWLLNRSINNDHEKEEDEEGILSYFDTLMDLQLPGSTGRKLTDDEKLSLCSEFLMAGTDTTSTTLQWAMANLVKNQDVQKRLLDEINSVVKSDEEITLEHLPKMPYLKAVVLETLRRHPPAHFILPRAVLKDTVIDGYDIPKDALVNFAVAEMSWDENVWEEPMEFRPERFIPQAGQEGAKFDIKGVADIKMMPFGAGKRICPAITISLMHIEYFVANLVRDFEWKVGNDEEVDLTEKQVFTVVMKYPLTALLSPRIQ
ncbi:hypothetical protein M0R45_025425 [Rubus argutus]|uniref:Cytochrome P450 n=1 Tax=Rubus argutus TaxID=59490 RepID=A0AAW1WUK7_RUBAR